MTDDNHESELVEARAAVLAAAAAVAEADFKMNALIAMLGRHFRLGVLAVLAAAVIGLSMFYIVMSVGHQTEWTRLQATVNEVEVLRHRVNERDGHRRLCAIALGASRGPELAGQICGPVVGDDYEALKKRLVDAERQLAKLRDLL